jgi:predicted DNA-binding ribbon-helix-helix protein
MKNLDLSFQFEDDQYEMLEKEARNLEMTIEELIANMFSVLVEEIREDVRVRDAVEQANL